MSDYRVTVKVRNARLLRAIRNAGYESIPKFAAAAGVSYATMNDLVNMTASPLDRTGGVRTSVEKIMDFLCEPFEALFSEAQCNALATNKSERDVTAEQVFALLHEEDGDPLDLICHEESAQETVDLLDVLTPRERKVLEGHLGLLGDPETLRQIADKMEVTHERVRQIEAKALRKLRQHVCRVRLKEYVGRTDRWV